MTTTNESPVRNLRRFNLFMGLFHFIQGLLMLALSDLSFKLPVTTAFLKIRRNHLQTGLQSEDRVRPPAGPDDRGVSVQVRFGALSDFHAGNLQLVHP
jgi:hypothetical protein